MEHKLKTISRFVFFLGIGVFLVWWSVRDLTPEDRNHISAALQKARYWMAVPGLLLLLISHYLRALRWKLLIDPLGYQVSKANSFFAVMIGYLANQAIPRLGELVKCSTLARYEKVPLDKLIGTVIIERVFDSFCLLIVFVITLAIQPDLYSRIMTTFFPTSEGAVKTNLLLWALIAIGIVAVGIVIWMLVTRRSVSDLYTIFKKIISRVWEGLTTIRHLKKRGAFITLTILIWVLYTLSGYIGFLALQETDHLGLTEALTVLCAGSVGMISTPGGIGAYPFLLQKTLQLYAVNSGTALAYGWLLWLMQIVVVLNGGVASLLALPIYNKRKQQAPR